MTATPSASTAKTARGSERPAKEAHEAPRSAVTPMARADVPAGAAVPKPRPRASKRPSTVADLMRSPAVCCRLGDTLQRAAQLMWEQDVGAVVVVDDGNRPRHVVTDRDVCMGAYTQGLPLWSSPLSSLGPVPVVSCSIRAGVTEARRLMKEHGVRRIPVVDTAGVVVGMVGLGDLTREATAATPKDRARGLSATQLAQALAAVYEDTGVPAERARHA
jgi:CBS domain-containing protein